MKAKELSSNREIQASPLKLDVGCLGEGERAAKLRRANQRTCRYSFGRPVVKKAEITEATRDWKYESHNSG